MPGPRSALPVPHLTAGAYSAELRMIRKWVHYRINGVPDVQPLKEHRMDRAKVIHLQRQAIRQRVLEVRFDEASSLVVPSNPPNDAELGHELTKTERRVFLMLPLRCSSRSHTIELTAFEESWQSDKRVDDSGDTRIGPGICV